MTFNDNADISNHRTKRGRRGAVVGGTVGGLGIIGVIIALLSGGNIGDALSGLLGEQQPTSQNQDSGTGLEKCTTGESANQDDECRLAGAQLALDQYWEGKVDGYRAPELIVVNGQESTQCGTASNATGPFYCPPEENIYVDPTFFEVLGSQFGADMGNLAQLYVVGHEWGHHIQQITGIMDQNPQNGSGPGSNGVRMELQADCFAGAWIADMEQAKDANGVSYLKPSTEAEREDALEAAATVGDDHIQESQTGRTNPESWTHGSSEQRMRWFATGYQYGLDRCDAFAPSAREL